MVTKIDGAVADKAWTELVRISGMCDMRQARYIRNLNRYLNNRTLKNDLNTLYDVTANYNFTYYSSDSDNYTTFNVIKSGIDTVTSKISQSRVRPFFSTVDGTFKARKACNSAQKFFDLFYDAQNVYNNAAECARDAMIFDAGVMWIDDDRFQISRVPPFNVYVDPYEFANDCISKCAMYIKRFPVTALEKYIGKNEFTNDSRNEVSFCIYYDLSGGKKYYYVEGRHVLTKSIKYKVPPFEWLYWSNPIKGFFSTSAADELYNIQCKIDQTEISIKDAFRYSIKNTYLVPDGANIKASKMKTEGGQVITYQPTPTPYPPIQVVTPEPISPMYQARLDDLIRKGYEMLGVSMLSAQSKKPGGNTSGVALETLQDVESERFNVFLRSYIAFLTNVAKKCIDIFPKDEEIIPNRTYKGITWGDMVEVKDSYQVQFSSASALSKDPSEKIKQIQSLMSMGFIDTKTASTLLDMPDLERAYSIVNASYDYCDTIIERVLESDTIPEFSPVVDLDMLLKITATYIMRMDVNNAPKAELEKLTNLFKKAGEIKKAAMQSTMPPAPEEMPPSDMPVAQDMPQSGMI